MDCTICHVVELDSLERVEKVFGKDELGGFVDVVVESSLNPFEDRHLIFSAEILLNKDGVGEDKYLNVESDVMLAISKYLSLTRLKISSMITRGVNHGECDSQLHVHVIAIEEGISEY